MRWTARSQNEYDRRASLARGLDRATVVEVPFRGSYLVRPAVTLVCAPVLKEIAELVRNERHIIPVDLFDAIHAFTHDGASPFFDRDVDAAHTAATRLHTAVEHGISDPPRGVRARVKVRRARRLGTRSTIARTA
jgi:hypothetical protein